MRRLLLLAAVPPLWIGCRRETERTPSASPSASVSAPAASSSAPEPPRSPRFASPVSATMRGGELLVAGARRGGGGLLVVRQPLDGGVATPLVVPPVGDVTPSDVDWMSGDGAIGLLVDTGPVQAVLARDPAGLAASTWRSSDGGACIAGDRLFSVTRGDGGFAVSGRPLDGAEETHGIPAGLSASLTCAQRTAVVIVEDGGRRVGRRVGSPKDAALVGSDEERAFSLVPAGDAFVAVRLGARGLTFRSWDDALGPITTSPVRFATDATLELAVASPDVIAVVTSRPVASPRDCGSADDTDAVAELVLLDRATGKALRDPERLDKWTCGADPGPFFGGVVGGKIVVAWPRGASAACAKVGVRWGGVAWVGTSGEAPAKVMRLDAPAEDLIDAGCDGTRCVILALSRAREGACLPASDVDAGELRPLVLTP